MCPSSSSFDCTFESVWRASKNCSLIKNRSCCIIPVRPRELESGRAPGDPLPPRCFFTSRLGATIMAREGCRYSSRTRAISSGDPSIRTLVPFGSSMFAVAMFIQADTFREAASVSSSWNRSSPLLLTTKPVPLFSSHSFRRDGAVSHWSALVQSAGSLTGTTLSRCEMSCLCK